MNNNKTATVSNVRANLKKFPVGQANAAGFTVNPGVMVKQKSSGVQVTVVTGGGSTREQREQFASQTLAECQSLLVAAGFNVEVPTNTVVPQLLVN